MSPVSIAPIRSPALLQRSTVKLGYVPLTDAAPLLVAQAKGFFTRHGLDVQLSAMPAWAAIRDRVAFGALNGAHMLSPMAIATTAGLGGVQRDVAVVATLGLNGNTVTLSEALWAEIVAAAPEQAVFPLPASALAAALARRRARGIAPPMFAVVFSYSSHNYLLRYWLAAGGIDPEHDVRLVVVPPPQVSEQLADGAIDGFCAGEPWGSRAVELRVGRIALTSANIWQNHPEKILAFAASEVASERNRIVATIAAVIEAGRWLDEPGNHQEAAHILCGGALAGIPADVVTKALTGNMLLAPDTQDVATTPMVFNRSAASFPFLSHEQWWTTQMRRWQHLPPAGARDQAPPIWRTDLWREAALLVGEPAPLADSKAEGTHATEWHLPANPAPIAMQPDRLFDALSSALS